MVTVKARIQNSLTRMGTVPQDAAGEFCSDRKTMRQRHMHRRTKPLRVQSRSEPKAVKRSREGRDEWVRVSTELLDAN